MKLILKSTLLLALSIVIISSCKKGEEDPFLSLRTRKARISGEWTLKSGSVINTYNNNTETTTYTGTSQIDNNGTTAYTEKWSIKRDGSFEMITTGSSSSFQMKGYWSFGNKIKDLELKNKESVIFRVTEETDISGGSVYTDKYTGLSCPLYSIVIKELRNKKMVFDVAGSDTWNNNKSESSGTMIYEQ